MNPLLVQKRNEFETKQKTLELVFKQAGDAFDLSKVTLLKGATDAEKAKEVEAMNAELEALDAEIKQLVNVEFIAKKNGERKIDAVSFLPQGKPAETPAGQFKNFGEFIYQAVTNPRKMREMGIKDMKAMGIDSGEAGGFAVPDEMTQNILMADPKLYVVRPRARVIPAGAFPDGKLEIPALRQGVSGVYGGVTFTGANEGTQGSNVDPKFDLVTLEPQRQSAWVAIGNSLLRNAPAMSSFVEALFREAKAGWEELKFLQGVGMTEPVGFKNVMCKLNQVRTTAATIVYGDITGMLSKQYGENPFWIASKSALPKLMSLADAVGNSIWIQGNIAAGIPPALAGLPIYFTWRQPTLGNEGDLMLVDASYYLIKDGSGPYVAGSEHVLFREDQTVVKLTFFIDAQSWVKTPLTLEDGTQASPIVVLK